MRCGKLPHPDTFHQAPTYCFYYYFSDDVSDIALLGIHFFKSDEKRSVSRVHPTCSPLSRANLKVASRRPGSLGFPGNSGSRDALSTGGSYHTGASLQRSWLVPRPVVLDVLALS